MLYAIVAVIILILDQGLKYWTTMNLTLNEGTKALIPGIVRLTHVQNYGAAFSFLKNLPFARWLFVAVTIIFCVGVIYALAKHILTGRFGRWMAVLVTAGAIGNGIDRTINGYVVDMFELQFMHFAVFNVADIFITVGGILFCLYILFHRDPESAGARGKKAGKKPETPRDKRGQSGGPSASVRRTPPVPPKPFINPFEEPQGTQPDLFAAGRVPTVDSLRTGLGYTDAVHRETFVPSGPPLAKTTAAQTAQAVKVNQAVRHAPAEPNTAADDDSEYSLESILAEFGSK